MFRKHNIITKHGGEIVSATVFKTIYENWVFRHSFILNYSDKYS